MGPIDRRPCRPVRATVCCHLPGWQSELSQDPVTATLTLLSLPSLPPQLPNRCGRGEGSDPQHPGHSGSRPRWCQPGGQGPSALPAGAVECRRVRLFPLPPHHLLCASPRRFLPVLGIGGGRKQFCQLWQGCYGASRAVGVWRRGHEVRGILAEGGGQRGSPSGPTSGS